MSLTNNTYEFRFVDAAEITFTLDDVAGTVVYTGSTFRGLFPERRKPYKVFPDGVYKPSELGLHNLHGVHYITIGKCKNKRKSRPVGYAWQEIAHAHPQDGMICMKNGAYVFMAEGKVDDTLIHEYVHILTPNDLDHGKEWSDIMTKYGLQPSRFAEYIYEVE